ncbi:MAG: cytochrome b/b6 domain-containing protein [Acidobacteriota bacterium]
MSTSITRFSLDQRVEHVVVMVLFIVLSVTGLPQKYFDLAFSRWLIDLLGGVDRIRWFHRAAGLTFAAMTAIHLMSAILSVARGRAPLSIVPNRKDYTDAIQMMRYYLGRTDQPAQFDRFDYRQKFEYWGMVLGAVVVIVTGLVLYFPIPFTQWLPGELIPAAKVAHSNEGLMAFLVVIVWHIYNAHLNPDVFPFDTSIFTGKVSIERMRHEHPLELARLKQVEEIEET